MSMVDYTILLMLSISILILTSIGLLTSLAILFLIFKYRRQHPINGNVLLVCNTYLAIALSCVALLDMYAHKFYRHINPNASFKNWWCYARAYLLHVGLCSIYHSYLLQTSFRFFRIVSKRRRILQESRWIIFVILVQWIVAFLFMLFILLNQHFQYIPPYSHCQIPFTDIRGLVISASVVYYGPMFLIVGMYVYIVHFINRSCNVSIRRNRRRDVFVFRRILSLIGLLMAFCLPAILMWVVYMITGYLYDFIYHFQWFTFALSMAILPIGSAMITTHVKHLINFKCRKNAIIHPMVVPRYHIRHPVRIEPRRSF